MKTNKPYGVIYCITCNINGKVYIGQTVNFQQRMYSYKNLHCKHQPQIYNALKKHGVENFSYEIIDEGVSYEDLNELERYYITLSKSRNREYGYNTREAGSKGKHSEETKKKNSKSHKGITHTKEARKKMVISRTGKKHSEETKKKMSQSRKGRKLTEEHKDNISKSHVGKKHTKEHRIKNSLAKKGKSLTSDHKTKISQSSKGRTFSEESIKKIKESVRISWIKRKENKQQIQLDNYSRM